MSMTTLYETDEEEKQHTGAIHFFAHSYHLDESRIREIYEHELAKLADCARIRTYLSVLTLRRVTEIVNHAPDEPPKT